ncbi:SWIM zinc finger family protein [Actinokineospora auranticolor]|uniref:SWIM zinc finger family protein n=1 Tax=Actinokineospora auranticolor TaxID=155976 RepID=UPI0035A8FBE4
MAPWSAERVIGLAPDAASAKAGRGLATAAKWADTGASEDALWGHCQGSGKKPYQACVELAEPAYRCTCPSRKFPCKHVLGLMLLWSAGAVAAAEEEPEWVGSWLESRAGRAERARQRAESAGPRDEKAAAKRADERLTRVRSGAAELREWLTDRLGAGLGGLRGGDELRTVAARMVDAQAPGLASGLRRAAALADARRGAPQALLGELSMLFLLADSVSRLDELPAELVETVRTRLGFPVDTARVLESGERVSDDWLVVGVSDEENDGLVTRRAWLRGERSDRTAVVLAFAPPGRPLDGSLPTGHVVSAELAFHPGVPPLRASVVDRAEPVLAPEPRGVAVDGALDGYARALAADPWTDRVPVVLARVVPTRHGESWALSDEDGKQALPLVSTVDPWPLLALAATGPVTVAAEWGATGLHPLTCWHDGRVIRL